MRLRGGGVNRNFTVRRITHGVGVERTFLLNSPRLEKIDVIRHARVRRKQLYYLRGLTGRTARLKDLRPTTTNNPPPKPPTVPTPLSNETLNHLTQTHTI